MSAPWFPHLDDRVVAVLAFSLQRLERAVGEEGVVAPDGKQLALDADGGGLGSIHHPTHDQAGGDLLGLGP